MILDAINLSCHATKNPILSVTSIDHTSLSHEQVYLQECRKTKQFPLFYSNFDPRNGRLTLEKPSSPSNNGRTQYF